MKKKFTKIVTTISDIRCDVEFLRKLHEAGMNVVRCNTAHMTTESINAILKNTRAVSDKIAILVDTKGPEIRTTPCEQPIIFEAGKKIIVKGDPKQTSSSELLCVSYAGFVNDLSVGKQILIDDGDVSLRVDEKHEDYLVCTIENSGRIKDGRKSVNVPGVSISLPSLTEKDKSFVLWAIENNVDFIAHSFVRSAKDVKEIQDILDAHNSPIKIIAKIENEDGVNNIDEIINCTYGIMVARGDLGIEVPIERIPFIQRALIRKCIEAKKPVIVATQMLHTMIENPRPTRAEVTDIANAIYHRTDAIMLSGETTYGKYPVEAVQTMARVANVAEDAKDSRNDIPVPPVKNEIATYLAESVVGASKELPIKAIIADSFTGKTARYIAAFRSPIPVYSLCYEARVARELSLSYGVFADVVEEGKTKSETLRNTVKSLQASGDLNLGDLVAYIGGSIGAGTSFLEILTVENLLKKIDSYIN
ncbi:MAG: pyruvate kinase [Bacteroidales bacterium]|jgi:pyruvate kinase|nr:pyruvate kinase [Bacteroidales bacterium]